MTVHTSSKSQRVEAIILDLDDTLVDTFTLLITPLELKAAAEMVAAGLDGADPLQVAELILRLRRDDPLRIEERLAREFPRADGKVLEVRRGVFSNASPDGLLIDPAVKDMLRELQERYDTYLLTTGETEFQNRKVELLGIRDLFREIVILVSGAEETKELWLSSLMRGRYHPESVIVVGNRLDNEIQAGNRLGMITVWVKHGEGSGLEPDEETGLPTYTIPHIYEFPRLLSQLEKNSRQ